MDLDGRRGLRCSGVLFCHELVQMINGHVMAILVDDDATKAKANGLIGLQCAGNGPVKISFRNVWLKEVH